MVDLEARPGPSGGDLKYQRIRPSSALPVLSPVREIIRPAGAKEAKNAVFGCAGRTFSRNRCRTGRWESFVPVGLLAGACWGSFVPVGLLVWVCWGSFVPGLAQGAVQSSPCSASWWWRRYKVLPARAKLAEMGICGCVGRVLYRLGCWCGCAGGVLYRAWHWARYKVLPARLLGGGGGTKFSLLGQNRLKWAFVGVLGEFCTGFGARCGTKFSLLGVVVVRAVQSSPCSASWWCERYKVLPAGGRGGGCGTKFSLLGQNRLKWAILGVLGEFCTGWAAGVGVLGEFCAGWAAGVGVLGEFCAGWAAGVGVLGEFCIGWVAGGGVRGAISHAIPLSVFQNLNSDR